LRWPPEFQEAFDDAIRVLERLRAELVEVALPEAGRAYEVFGVIQRAEALFAHTQAGLFPARRAEYGEDVRRRLELAATVQTSDYLAASARSSAPPRRLRAPLPRGRRAPDARRRRIAARDRRRRRRRLVMRFALTMTVVPNTLVKNVETVS